MEEQIKLSALESTVEKAIESTREALDPHARIAKAFRDAAARQYPDADREQWAASFIKETAGRLRDLLWRWDLRAVSEELVRFHVKINEIAAPPPVVPEFDRIMPTCRAYLWRSDEISAAVAMLKPGEKIGAINERSMVINGRDVSRREIRLALMPCTFQLGEEEWLGQFPRIPEVVIR